MAGTHTRREDFPWMIAVVDHPERTESRQYRASRKLMNTLARQLDLAWTFAPAPYQDHHGGAVWVMDGAGWMCLQLSLGIEWSAQFCADPAKVDRLRQQAARVVAAFPGTLDGYAAHGYHGAETMLQTEITTARQVAAWTDSIFNASFPLPAGAHTGVLPKGAGYHHYPKPIVDIDHFRYDDFRLFVTDAQHLPAVVVPVSPRGSGDGRVRLLAAHPDSPYAGRLTHAADARAARAAARPGTALAAAARAAVDDSVLLDDDPLARQAFRQQHG